MLCRVNFFMGQRGVIAFGIPERLEGWHLHPVNAFGIERPVAAMAHLDAGSSKEGLRIRNALHRIKDRQRRSGVLFRQSLDLLDVKD
ncbi:Hypothetical protein NGAL_HAMBI2605_58910 [Neorhizobium galegae bv. orientalis]|nr:Hypothetical protein NGAL_HAMBI2566_61480 [Neorhizobium galegae bv. orientalis]CDZ67610.1 Hypothetical protein NGAL_HAMBI2605_58910 [Neorhizobium galegae bv. orientalis]